MPRIAFPIRQFVYTPKIGDTIEPVPSKRFPTVEKYKWTTGLVQGVTPSGFDDSQECEVIIIHAGKEVRFWEYSDNIRLKEDKKL